MVYIMMSSSMMLLMTKMTPLKVSFLVMITSMIVSLQIYWQYSSVFTSASVVISFSSGMMILFCYCASLNSYESTNKNKMSVSVPPLMIFVFMTSTMEKTTSTVMTQVKMSMSSNTMFVVVGMMVVILTMVGINKAMFNPTKTLNSSY